MNIPDDVRSRIQVVSDWTAREVKLLSDNYKSGMKCTKIRSEFFPYRSIRSVYYKRRCLGLPPRTRPCVWDQYNTTALLIQLKIHRMSKINTDLASLQSMCRVINKKARFLYSIANGVEYVPSALDTRNNLSRVSPYNLLIMLCRYGIDISTNNGLRVFQYDVTFQDPIFKNPELVPALLDKHDFIINESNKNKRELNNIKRGGVRFAGY